MGKKNILMFISLVFSCLLSGKIYASDAKKACAAEYGWTPNSNSAVTMQYNHCVSEANRMAQEQANAPKHPGTPPIYDCEKYNQPLIPESTYVKCKGDYDVAKAKYNSDLALYQDYMSAHPNINNVQHLTTAQVLEDVAAKQQKEIDKLKDIAKWVQYLAIITGLTGGALMMWTPTAPAGKILLAIAAGLQIINLTFTMLIIPDLEKKKITTCEQLNKVLTKPMSCDLVKEQTPGDGRLTITNYGFNGTGGTSEIPPFIDPTTGQCKSPVTAECTMLVKNAPKDCFKSKNGSKVSCLAGIDKNKFKQYIPVVANGKVSMNVDGKQRTFGAEDFANEASMIKAGFTKDQAKQFHSLMNSPDSILSKNGINAKGELIKSTNVPTVSLSTPSSSSSGTGASGAASMTTKKDEYGTPTKVQEVARVPASAEGLTKDYHGEKIGAEGDDVFKMINRRYILKQKQNIFLEQ